ncbi:uroporphyrinogen-III C-methyltransferase [Flammeovirgaceae bacterium SG7u.111]|nr:uroporphyrinogen-III C-methyltransferase [Flammeovirgaceae bacterium SG7u.132]WPO35312.1 uroporphyrinogen-III C-methyltransferase [Flammeovirgaceae bacterium SG7u.111]
MRNWLLATFTKHKPTRKSPRLTLVGAGPGDPELVTLKAVKAISNADVILHDALVHPSLLEYAKPEAKKIFVGKRAGKHHHKQEEINQLIVENALDHGHVIRLKGGDPFVFGRGKEEKEFAESFGIEVDVIPGVTSVTLPGYYGIPLTKRGVNESFWVITATTSSGKLSADVTLAAQSTATVVLFMGLKKAREIAEVFEGVGKNHLPVAIISRGSWEDGKVHFATIDTLEEQVASQKIASPALIVIGEAVGSHEYFYEQMKQVTAEIW